MTFYASNSWYESFYGSLQRTVQSKNCMPGKGLSIFSCTLKRENQYPCIHNTHTYTEREK